MLCIEAYHQNFFSGYPDKTFKPERPISRAEVASSVGRAFSRLSGLQPVYPSTPTFSDTDSSHWAYGAIEAIAKAGIILGYPDGTFKPDQNITRAEYVTIACKSLLRRGPFKDGEINNPYPDVKPIYWAYEYIMEASIPHVVVNPERFDVLIVIPSKKIPIYTEGPDSTITVPNIGDIVINVIVPVDGLTQTGADPAPREVTIRIIVKGGLP
ncbi:MAG: S-layer homology domain-containing protein [Bacteroidia bacterium]|nr:S-layer homology domain-containing protein [Bacteroidia bacterium]